MILPITQYGNPVLRVRCKPVKEVTEEVRNLAEDMIETMIDANGVGLAAPQVAVELRMAVVDISHSPESITYLRVDGKEAELAEIMPLIFINPELETMGEPEVSEEGCLSIQDIQAPVKRPSEVKGRFELLDGRVLEIETDGLLARAIQHEVDHLNGILFVDRLSAASKLSVRGKLKRLNR